MNCGVTVSGLVNWPVRWETVQTGPGSGSSFGPGCWLLLQQQQLRPQLRALRWLQHPPAKSADSPRRADCWTEAAAVYLQRERRPGSVPAKRPSQLHSWTWQSLRCVWWVIVSTANQTGGAPTLNNWLCKSSAVQLSLNSNPKDTRKTWKCVCVTCHGHAAASGPALVLTELSVKFGFGGRRGCRWKVRVTELPEEKRRRRSKLLL